ncbi:hypothetical protein [Tenacibaculum sp. 190524A02b]|uniref:hypothetical protein n=1 Tax=Tenacibaculum vairaonense TaxID=3137860 RepID=UPI0031FB86C4
MKSPVQLSNEIVKLKEAYQKGILTKSDVVKEYKYIIEEISLGLGNSHPVVLQLSQAFNEFIVMMESVKKLNKNLNEINDQKLTLYKSLDLL